MEEFVIVSDEESKTATSSSSLKNIEIVNLENIEIKKEGKKRKPTKDLKQHTKPSKISKKLGRPSGKSKAAVVITLSDSSSEEEGKNDVIIEPQRAQLIPGFYEVKEKALESGALGCSISGAGPSIFALCANSLKAEQAGLAMQEVFNKMKIENELFISPINHEGAILM